jgi:phosphate transport system substrate-binding protein
VGPAARIALLTAGAICIALPVSAVQADGVQLRETGSTLLYPLFQQWVTDYAHVAPNIAVSTGATGSGAGIAAAMGGTAHIGGSDAYMSDQQA